MTKKPHGPESKHSNTSRKSLDVAKSGSNGKVQEQTKKVRRRFVNITDAPIDTRLYAGLALARGEDPKKVLHDLALRGPIGLPDLCKGIREEIEERDIQLTDTQKNRLIVIENKLARTADNIAGILAESNATGGYTAISGHAVDDGSSGITDDRARDAFERDRVPE
jgi:hypothetical protein